jgi:small subunit ribosomal protein S11
MSEEENNEDEKDQEKPAEAEKAEEKAEAEKPAEAEKAEEKAEAEKPAEAEKAEEKAEAEKPAEAEKAEGDESAKSAEGKTAPDENSEKKEETAADLLGANIEQVKIRKAKGSKNIASGICFIVATFNNTKVSFSDMKGNVISWSSSGKCNFRGSRKSTAYAAQVVTQDAGKVAMSHGMKEVLVKVKGPGMGRDSAIRALQSLGFSVTSIIDVTPVPHNGCRPPKRRRV